MTEWRGVSIPEPMAKELEKLGKDEYIKKTYGVSGVPEIVRRACSKLILEWNLEIKKWQEETTMAKANKADNIRERKIFERSQV